jgi:hypothetical protein
MSQLVIENQSKTVLPDEGATAVVYLRVSSTGQLTGRSQEGYSIEGQREACERHAERLGARILVVRPCSGCWLSWRSFSQVM